ncbi:MAG: type II toxin-antitoxin system VapC family toxin [Pseudomonadota bacterium]|nr:type II toxin-antitoxin system VapC family toxin [Pseudomonadota bacterium]
MLLLDTCALLWYSLDAQKLSAGAKIECEKIPQLGGFVSAISIWEIGLKIKNGKLDINTNIVDYVKRLRRVGTIEIIPVDENIWMKNLELDWNHRDPADRTIVATAILKKLPIVTSDKIISDYYDNIIW